MRYIIWLLIAVPLILSAQTSEPILRSTVSEVLLDVVVRDKKAHIIRDLRPEEVQIFENGVQQKVRHFEFFSGHSTLAASTPGIPATATAPNPTPVVTPNGVHDVNELRDISVVSVVVAEVDPRGRKLALDTMRKFVQDQLQPNTYVGVFRLAFGDLWNVQPYTNDADTISKGMERAVRATSSTPVVKAGDNTLTPGSTTDQPPPPSSAAGAAEANANGPAAAIAQMMELDWTNEMQDVYQSSMEYLSPLQKLVGWQAQIPGRKVVLLFSAGLPVHADTHELLTALISRANRSNVSVFAVDTRGYSLLHADMRGQTPDSDLGNSRRLIAKATQESMRQQLAAGKGGDQTVTPSEMAATEIAENAIHANTRENLAELAEGTGGALLPDSLDLREPLSRAMEDVRTHYELSYSPNNLVADGSFRKIEVRVSRPGAKVFARSGYYALPVLNGRQIYPFEMATLKALNMKPALHQFNFHAAALEFRQGAEQTQLAFVFQVPLRNLTVTREGQWEKVHVCVTGLIKNDQGLVVQKISRDIPYEMPAAKKEELDRAVVSFTTPFLLPPGRYTLETAAVDRESMKASVSRAVMVVDEGSHLSMSDVSAVRRVDAIQGHVNAADPLEVQGVKVTPELTDVLSPGQGQVQLYAVAYPPTPIDAPVEADIEIWRDGQLVLRTPDSRVPPDASGAASILAVVPISRLPNGNYEAHIAFHYKGETVMKATTFTLATGI